MFKSILIVGVGVLFWMWRTGRLAMWVNGAGRSELLARKGGGEPRCGRCGYIVRGLGSFTCPECGKDLREVGIDVGRRESGGWVAVVWMAVVWSVAMYVMGLFVVEVAVRALPQSSRVVYSVRMERPGSHAYHVVTMQGGDVGRMDSGAVAMPKRVVNLMNLAGRNSTLDLDLSAGSYAYLGGDGKRVQVNGVFDAKAALDWMKAVGVDTAVPGVEAEVLEVVEKATAALPPNQGTTNFSSHTSGQTAGFGGVDGNWDRSLVEPRGMRAVGAGGMFLIWVGGMWWLVRRYVRGR